MYAQLRLKKYKRGKECQIVILETIEEFKHYKRIDNRFINALAKKGVYARFTKESFGRKMFQVREWIGDSYEIIESISVYSDNDSWEDFRDSIAETSWDCLINRAMKACNSQEYEKQFLIELRNQLKEMKFYNYTIFNIVKAINTELSR